MSKRSPNWASDLLLTPGTLMVMQKNLAAKGFVSRDRDLIDERRVWVRLTEEGCSLSKPTKHIPSAQSQLGTITD